MKNNTKVNMKVLMAFAAVALMMAVAVVGITSVSSEEQVDADKPESKLVSYETYEANTKTKFIGIFANGTPITIVSTIPNGAIEYTLNGYTSPSGATAYILWEENEQTAYVGYKDVKWIFGGSCVGSNTSSYTTTNILMEGGTVNIIVGGSLVKTGYSNTIEEVNIDITGGSFSELISGSISTHSSDSINHGKCIVEKVTTNIKSTNVGKWGYVSIGGFDSSPQCESDSTNSSDWYNVVKGGTISLENVTSNENTAYVYGGGWSGYTWVGESHVSVKDSNVNVIAGGVNGYTERSAVVVDGGTIGSISAGNRGHVGEATISVKNVSSQSNTIVTIGALTGSTSTDGGPNAIFDKIDFTIEEGLDIEKIYLGGSNWTKQNPWDDRTDSLSKTSIDLDLKGYTILAYDVGTDSIDVARNYTIGNGETWNIGAGTNIVIPSGSKIINNGTVTNNGSFSVNGTLLNSKTFDNYGTLTNNGTVTITTADGKFTNYGTLINNTSDFTKNSEGTITNKNIFIGTEITGMVEEGKEIEPVDAGVTDFEDDVEISKPEASAVKFTPTDVATDPSKNLNVDLAGSMSVKIPSTSLTANTPVLIAMTPSNNTAEVGGKVYSVDVQGIKAGTKLTFTLPAPDATCDVFYVVNGKVVDDGSVIVIERTTSSVTFEVNHNSEFAVVSTADPSTTHKVTFPSGEGYSVRYNSTTITNELPFSIFVEEGYTLGNVYASNGEVQYMGGGSYILKNVTSDSHVYVNVTKTTSGSDDNGTETVLVAVAALAVVVLSILAYALVKRS